MPRRDWPLRIADMQEAADKVIAYVAGMTFEDFSADSKTIDAVLRNVEIMGEAAGHVPKSVRERHGSIRWADIKGMRDVLIHGYFRVDARILWNVTQSRVPQLSRQLEELRKSEDF